MQGFAKRYSLTCNSERTTSKNNNNNDDSKNDNNNNYDNNNYYYYYNYNETVGNAILHGSFTANNLARVNLIKLVHM